MEKFKNLFKIIKIFSLFILFKSFILSKIIEFNELIFEQ